MRSIVSIPSLRGGLVLAALLAASCSSDSQVLVEPCPGGYTNCGTVCADLLADAKHCGACGAACPAGVACSNGVCAIDLCPAPRLVCGDRCVDPASDPLNCGACGVFCPSGQACVFGACSCPVGYSACNGQCIELASNPYNCGACGLACALGQSCVAGQCQCQVGLTNCGGVCVNLAGDGAHCGACDNACAPGLLCAAGACAATCPTGMDPCAETGSCVVLATDPRNCGVCGHACGVGEVCVDGRCGCPAGTADCTGTGRCDDIATDLANCGACGQSCAIGQACVDGVCGCSVAGQQVCDGVCVDPSQDPFNCGVCGHACTGGSSCSAGQCVGGGVGGSGGTTGGAGGTTGGTGGTTGGTGGTTGGTGGTTGGAGGTTGGAGGTGGTTGGTGGTGVLTGYHRHDPWQGFAWTAVDSGERATITPEAFDDLTTDGPYCVQGNVPVTADYSAIAMVGFNVNQASTASAPLETWTPASLTEGGLLVNVTNRSGSTSVIRVQIQGPDGDESADDRWCAPLSQFNRDVIIPWDSFNTACWNNSGDYYAGQAIEAALVFVPGMGTDDTNPQDRAFDFCVNAIGPDDSSTGTGGTGGGTGACSNTVTGAGTITERYGLGYLKDGTRNAYVVQNNGWGSGFSSQTLTYSGASFTIGSATGSPGGDNAPFSYPSIFIGSNGSASSTGSDLPKQLSAISSLPTCLAWSGGSGEFNVAYDVWFNQTNTSSNPPTGAYLMVWYHDPAGYQPKGSSVATVSLAGRTWAVWHGMNGAVPVVSYVPTGDLASFSFDLMEFIDDSVERGYLQNSWYLTAVMGGFEIWTSGEGYRLDGFSAVVN